MAQKKEQWFMITAASLFLAGAVFMLVNTFGAQEWALWVGIGCALGAVLLYTIVEIARARFNKKYTARESEIMAKQQKAAETAHTAEAVPISMPESSPAPETAVKNQPAKPKTAGQNKSQKKSSKKPISKKKK